MTRVTKDRETDVSTVALVSKLGLIRPTLFATLKRHGLRLCEQELRSYKEID